LRVRWKKGKGEKESRGPNIVTGLGRKKKGLEIFAGWGKDEKKKKKKKRKGGPLLFRL